MGCICVVWVCMYMWYVCDICMDAGMCSICRFSCAASRAGVCTCSCVWYMHMFTFCMGDICEHVHVCLVYVHMFMSVRMSGDQRLTSGVVFDRVTIVVMKNHGQSNLVGKRDLFGLHLHITVYH